jgi:hypothetical protein
VWNTILSLSLLTTGGTPKAAPDWLVTATKRATTAGGLIRGNVLASFVRKAMDQKQVYAILGEPHEAFINGGGQFLTECFRGGVVVDWGEEVTINGQTEIQAGACVSGPSFADIWAALTGRD